MKDFIPVEQLYKKVRKRRISVWLDKLKFFHILLIWVFVIIFFGFVYYLLTDNKSYLFYPYKQQVISDIANSIYFSFVATTTASFGDIVPIGQFRLLAIFEIIAGTLLLAIVISKIISLKQDVILNEVYDLSLNEKINRLRSSLLLFRQNLNRIITKVEEGDMKKREVSDIYTYISSFEDILNEIIILFNRQHSNHFTKKLDNVSTELILNSIMHSFDKINELITTMKEHKIEWKRDIVVALIKKCISLDEELFSNVIYFKNITDKTLGDIIIRKNKIIGDIESLIN